jgi:hypothetical protein
MKRSKFVRNAALLMLATPIIPLVSCSSDADPAPPATPDPDAKDCLANGTTSSISTNHGRAIVVSKEDVENEVEMTYAIQGTGTHGHNVTISATQFASLKANQSIQVTSETGGGHTHAITVSCA